MRDVIIVGGGLSGLIVAGELEKYEVDYTLIEVKSRLGGSILTTRYDDFVMDSSLFVIEKPPLPDDLKILDSLYLTGNGLYAFKNGAQSLIEMLHGKITDPTLMRMAVSSVGRLGNHFMVCLENGLTLSARALIIAAPARYAERMFYGYIPEISQQLLDYQYDKILRISLGYRQEDLSLPIAFPPSMAYAFQHWTTDKHRTPAGHVLLQLGVRVDLNQCGIEHALSCVFHELKLPQPVTQRVDFWAEADPISCYDDHHIKKIQAINNLLPPGIALIGSDYCLHPTQHKGIASLAERFQQAQSAAQRIAEWLKERS